MDKYTIYCTEEQTRRALNLNAPLDKVYKRDMLRPVIYTLPQSDTKWQDCDAYYIPTAQQMICWMEEEYGMDITIGKNFYDINCMHLFNHDFYGSRRAAMLAAIDAAFNYIET